MQCPKCGAILLADEDGLGCLNCGWHDWTLARESASRSRRGWDTHSFCEFHQTDLVAAVLPSGRRQD